ncbi:MAG: CBS domain-containing protein [Bacteroidota bacterium]
MSSPMTVLQIMSPETAPLLPSDTVEHALGLLLEFRLRHLPVVDDEGRLIGMVSEEQLLDASGPDAPLSSLYLALPIHATPDLHVFDATRMMMAHDLTMLAVADEDNAYLGLIRRSDLFERFATMLATQEPGTILLLEVPERDYSLSQLVYATEQTGARILSVATEPHSTENGTIGITLKLNITDTSRVRHVMEHYGYKVVALFGEDEDDEAISIRVQEFMRYLEV